MKLFSTHLRRCPEQAIPVAGLALALVLAAGGCVTRGTYDEVVTERDVLERKGKRLAGEVARLEQSNRNLDAELAQIADAKEDLRQANATLATDLGKVRKSEALLSEHLEDRERRLSTATEELQMLRELSEGGKKVLRKISNGFAKATYLVEVQGHTDNVPTSARLAKRYKTNWELAAARATEVVRVIADSGVDPTRLRATSYGPFQPVADNATREGRGKNRRIEIRLTPLEASNSAGASAGT